MPKKTTPNYQIHLSLEQIPEVTNPMPVMKLGAPVLAPRQMIQDLVRTIAPKAEFKEMGNTGAQAAYEGHRLVAFISPKTGPALS